MTQPSLLDLPPTPIRRAQHVQATSAAQYRALARRGTLATRQTVVLEAVAALRVEWDQWPTACEIQRWLEARLLIPPDGNPSHVRPRCFELAEMGHVTRGPKRRSRLTGITCLTWELADRERV